MALPTLPPGLTEARHSRSLRRERILHGDWVPDVQRALRGAFGIEQAEIIKLVSGGWNLGKDVVSKLSVLYTQGPPEEVGAIKLEAEASAWISASGVWASAPRFQKDVLAQHVCARYLELDDEGALQCSSVIPAYLAGEGKLASPTKPTKLGMWQPRAHLKTGQLAWVLMWWDLTGDQPKHWAEAGGNDVSEDYIPGGRRDGDSYRVHWSYSDGTPFIPLVLTYREAGATELLPTEGEELWASTIEVAAYVSFVAHCLRNAAYRRMVSIDLEPLDTGSAGGDHAPEQLPAGVRSETRAVLQRRSSVSDPTIVHEFVSVEEAKSPTIKTLEMSADPGQMLTVVERIAQGAAIREGIAPGSLKRTSGGGIASGYAIELSREDQRSAQERFAPSFAPADAEFMRKAVAMRNRAVGEGVQPWSEHVPQLVYPAIALSAAEERALREQLDWELEKGFVTPAQALARLRGIDETQAAQVLRENAFPTQPRIP